ncbi:MAG: dihydrolipoamide acyltransferase [Ruminococcaceae bacterium]|nr:dihydrolipoamide acyltransferase [Oscillospiraceae bacterium]
MDIKVGMTATVQETVTDKNTAETVGSGSLKVFATPAMVALMEKAACEALSTGLDEGSTTVGTLVNVEHVSATPLGMTVKVTVTVTEVEGRKIGFSVEAFDEVGLIGRGTHERFVVFSEKFIAKTESKGK